MPCLHPRYITLHRKSPYVDGDGCAYYKPIGYEDAQELIRVQVPCHNCYECRKRRTNDWRIRLLHEWKYGGNNLALFCTLSFSPANYPDILTLNRSGVRSIMRGFWDVFRKRYGYIPRYFFISEFGIADRKYNTKGHRFHLHGFMFFKPWQPCPPYKELHALCEKYFGYAWIEEMESVKALNYTLKYSTKTYCEKGAVHPLCGILVSSQGLGRAYVERNFQAILGDDASPDSPTRLRWIDDTGRPWTFAIPSYYKQYARRKTNSHKIAIVHQREPYLVKYGPFSVMSDAPVCSVAAVVARYEEWLSTFCDPHRYERKAAQRRRVRKRLYERSLIDVIFNNYEKQNCEVSVINADIRCSGS